MTHEKPKKKTSDIYIGYLQWHAEAERRFKRGERQRQCAGCGLWIFPNWAAEIAQHDQHANHEYSIALTQHEKPKKKTSEQT